MDRCAASVMLSSRRFTVSPERLCDAGERNLTSQVILTFNSSSLVNAKTYKALKPLDSYEPRGFYPASIGDTSYDGRYEVLYRFGYGVYSTV